MQSLSFFSLLLTLGLTSLSARSEGLCDLMLAAEPRETAHKIVEKVSGTDPITEQEQEFLVGEILNALPSGHWLAGGGPAVTEKIRPYYPSLNRHARTLALVDLANYRVIRKGRGFSRRDNHLLGIPDQSSSARADACGGHTHAPHQ
ncbi:MAG: hypothetical protein HC902_00810 [Calothrix sp. SM1_5_4]|nr:hypothetical protein [Calothrix sp. SM1_5_4]